MCCLLFLLRRGFLATGIPPPQLNPSSFRLYQVTGYRDHRGSMALQGIQRTAHAHPRFLYHVRLNLRGLDRGMA
jgi:hypothetical protein